MVVVRLHRIDGWYKDVSCVRPSVGETIIVDSLHFNVYSIILSAAPTDVPIVAQGTFSEGLTDSQLQQHGWRTDDTNY